MPPLPQPRPARCLAGGTDDQNEWRHQRGALAMAKVVNPPAELEPLPDDVELPLHLLSRLAPFTQLKSPPSLDKYPGACRLRYFRANEEVCTHGEPGWSAYCF